MGKFKEFLERRKNNKDIVIGESDFAAKNNVNDKVDSETQKIYDIIDGNKELQELIDAENEEEDAEDTLGESTLTEGNELPFGFEGTLYNGSEKLDVLEEDIEFQNLYEGKDESDEKKYTDTFIFLQKIKENPPTLDELKNNLQTIKIENGKLKRRGDKFYGNYVDMTDEDIQKLVDRVNEKRIIKRKVYDIKPDGGLYKKVVVDNPETGKEEVVKPEAAIKSPASMKRICKILNGLYEKDMEDILFWWENNGGSKDKIITISNDRVKRSTSNDKIHDFSNVQYEPLTDKKLQLDVCDKLGKAMNRKSAKNSHEIGYSNGFLTIDGVKMDEEQLKTFVRERNGIPDSTVESYWDSFNFLEEGSKIGKGVGSFSLPPGASCINGVPCAHEGCYAYPSFKYPTVRSCWMSNLAKLQEGNSKGKDRIKQFESECVKFITDHNLGYFRFHVSGDVDIGPNSNAYVAAICNIAKTLGNVKFWTYTKSYKAWDGASIPSNLVVLYSAWGSKEPTDTQKEMHPVAFLYDKDSDKIMKYMRGIDPVHFDEYESRGKKDKVVFCPCSDPSIKEQVTCVRCGLCFSRKEVNPEDGKTKIVGNIAFHKH